MSERRRCVLGVDFRHRRIISLLFVSPFRAGVHLVHQKMSTRFCDADLHCLLKPQTKIHRITFLFIRQLCLMGIPGGPRFMANFMAKRFNCLVQDFNDFHPL